jgi:hypothetical protein
MRITAHFSVLCARHNSFSPREKVAEGRMRAPSGRKNDEKVTKNHQKRQKSTLCAHFSAKKRAENDIVSEIELMTPSALTNASPVPANARCVCTSSRSPKPATFVDEAPPKPPIQEAEANQATTNDPPLPDTAIPRQTTPKCGHNGKSRIANIATKSCFDMHFARTKHAQKRHSRAQKRHFARISAQWQTTLWEKFASGEVSVVRGQWSVVSGQWPIP